MCGDVSIARVWEVTLWSCVVCSISVCCYFSYIHLPGHTWWPKKFIDLSYVNLSRGEWCKDEEYLEVPRDEWEK
jgi:hypothetical protein